MRQEESNFIFVPLTLINDHGLHSICCYPSLDETHYTRCTRCADGQNDMCHPRKCHGISFRIAFEGFQNFLQVAFCSHKMTERIAEHKTGVVKAEERRKGNLGNNRLAAVKVTRLARIAFSRVTVIFDGWEW